MKKSTKIIIVLILVAAALIIVVKIKSPKKQQASQAQNKNSEAASSAPYQITPIDKAIVPDGLPKDLPIEKGAVIVNNFSAKNPVSGATQYTRIYTSSKSLKDLFTIYKKYMTDNGWVIVGQIDQDDIKSLSATKGSDKLDVVINYQSKTKTNTVNVSVTRQ